MKFLKKDWGIIKYILLLFLGWRIALVIITFLGLSIVPYVGENGRFYLPNEELKYWERWSNWDGGHFRGIAENNYLPQQTVFFPLYPILIKSLMFFGIPSIPGGLILSHLFLILSLYFLYKLSRLDFTEQTSKNILFILLIFPTSFFFGAIYSESLFLFLTLASFYFARTKSYPLAFIFASLSTITRLIGLAVLLSIFIEYLLQSKRLKGSLEEKTRISLKTFLNKLLSKQTFYFLFSLIPLSLYMYFQKITFNNPFSFLTNEEHWQREFSLPWDTISIYLDNFKQTGLTIDLFYAIHIIEFSSFLIALICLFFSFKYLRPSYSFYFFLSLLLPLFSKTLLSYQRFILAIFPLFFILALIKNDPLQKFGIIISTMLLGFLSILFINGYWI